MSRRACLGQAVSPLLPAAFLRSDANFSGVAMCVAVQKGMRVQIYCCIWLPTFQYYFLPAGIFPFGAWTPHTQYWQAEMHWPCLSFVSLGLSCSRKDVVHASPSSLWLGCGPGHSESLGSYGNLLELMEGLRCWCRCVPMMAQLQKHHILEVWWSMQGFAGM